MLVQSLRHLEEFILGVPDESLNVGIGGSSIDEGLAHHVAFAVAHWVREGDASLHGGPVGGLTDSG